MSSDTRKDGVTTERIHDNCTLELQDDRIYVHNNDTGQTLLRVQGIVRTHDLERASEAVLIDINVQHSLIGPLYRTPKEKTNAV